MPSNYKSLRKTLFPTAHRLLLEDSLRDHYPILLGNLLVLGAGKNINDSAYPFASNVIYTDLIPESELVLYADAHQLTFSDNCFDSILSVEVFEHLHSPRQAAHEMYRVIKTGGVALVSVPFLFRIHGDPHDYHRFTLSGLCELFSSFEDVKVIPYGSRIHVISDIILTSNKFFSFFRFINYFLFVFSSLLSASSDCPSGYVVILRK